MTVNDRKVFVMALMLVVLMSVFVSVASATGSQTWYPHGAGEHATYLTKSAPSDGTETLTNNVWTQWFAVSAECDLTMPGGTWVLHLNYAAPCDGNLYVKVLNKDTLEVLNYEDNVAITTSTTTLNVDINDCPNSVDFTTGDHLLLKIKWIPGGTGDLTVNCGSGKTTLSSPSSDPGYPVPELSTLALFSVGLLALVGYVVYRRRNI